MRIRAVLPAVLLALSAPSLARAEDPAPDWRNAFEVEARLEPGAFTLAFVPKPGFFVNRQFPTVIELEAEGVVLEKHRLGKKDAKFEATEEEDKATRADFRVGARGEGRVRGTYKVVICSKTGCSSPLDGTLATR